MLRHITAKANERLYGLSKRCTLLQKLSAKEASYGTKNKPENNFYIRLNSIGSLFSEKRLWMSRSFRTYY